MSIRLYNVLKSSPAGEPWTGGQGGQFQTYFLDIEGVQGTIMCNRKTSSPVLGGPVWGEMEDGVTKAGKPKKTFKVKPKPDGAVDTLVSHTGAAGAPLASQVANDTISWGQALIAAATLYGPLKMEGGINGVVSIAKDLYLCKAPEVEPEEEDMTTKDVILTDFPDGNINLDDIPF